MKNKILMFLLLGIFMISFNCAWSEDEFNNSLSTENLTFAGDENITRWLQVPEDALVINAYLNLSGYGNEDDFEDIFSCDYNNTFTSDKCGTLGITNTFCDKSTDENWNTYSFLGNNGNWAYTNYIYENYTNIIPYSSASWKYKSDKCGIWQDVEFSCYNSTNWELLSDADGNNNNITVNIPNSCLSTTTLQIRGFFNATGVSEEGGMKYYEGAVIWNPINTSFYINNTQVWNQTGELNSTNSPQKTNNFRQTINNYIDTATAIAGYYLIPFIFHSDTAGILEYLALIFNNDGFIENSQTYENSTFSGGVEIFQLNITYDNNRYSNSQAYFYYNGDSYLATKTGTGSSLSFSKTLDIPIISTEINKTFHWQVELYDGTWEYYNSTFHNQTISLVYLGVCGGVSNDTLINMSLFDENTQTNITGNIQIDADITSKSTGEVIESLNTSFEDVQYGAICLSPVSSYNLYYLDMEIRYGSTGYASELYHIQKAELANATTLNLYDLNLSDSTEFKVTYQDDTFNFIEGAIVQLQRKYISEGVYKTVEAPLTSNEGVAILHIDLDSVKYRATVVKDGVTLDEFDNLVFRCQSELTGECEQKLLGEIDPSNDISIEATMDFSYSLSKIDNTITLAFSIPSGLPSSINMQMTQKDQFGDNEMCNNTITSSAGSIQCSYNDTIGDSYIDLEIYKNGKPVVITSYIILEDSDMGFFGNNYIVVVVLLLSIVGMALTSPEWIIINGIMVMVISGALWLINGLDFVVGLGNLMWLVIAAGILIFKLAKQEDR